MAEREGFPACEKADCTPCCWEGHSRLCTIARGWQGKSDIRHSVVKPLDLRFGTSWTNRTNKTKASSLPAILSWCSRCLPQQFDFRIQRAHYGQVHNFLFARHSGTIAKVNRRTHIFRWPRPLNASTKQCHVYGSHPPQADRRTRQTTLLAKGVSVCHWRILTFAVSKLACPRTALLSAFSIAGFIVLECAVSEILHHGHVAFHGFCVGKG